MTTEGTARAVLAHGRETFAHTMSDQTGALSATLTSHVNLHKRPQ